MVNAGPRARQTWGHVPGEGDVIEPPRLTFVTVERLPITLPAKSALTWPVV